MSASLTRLYQPIAFKPGQIRNAFKKLPGFLGIDEKKCSLMVHVTHANGIRERKDIGWNDLDTISEINHNAVSCVLFSYQPRGDSSCIIYIESTECKWGLSLEGTLSRDNSPRQQKTSVFCRVTYANARYSPR